jgi:hypothetical protein
MAWLILFFIIFVFFKPGMGLGSNIVTQDISLSISQLGNISVNIPYTGILKLFGYSIGVWLVAFLAVFGLEYAFRRDLFARLQSRKDYIDASQPHITNRLPAWLARCVTGFLVGKFMLIVLLQLLISRSWMAAESFVSLKVFLSQFVEGLKNLRSENDLVLLACAILVLIVGRVFKWEQSYRYKKMIAKVQQNRKKEQNEIVIPATQQ